ncbi:MAG TPA: hypothetical protein VED47_03075 [Burkholderiaceae bacterium]|nr:hypothetical protein [Burkholderiaceae bacterium]
MRKPAESVARLLYHLDRAAALREAAAADPKLEASRQQLRGWQAARLARTHADLLASPRMGLAAAFFLSDLYGSEDLTKLDANVRRVAPTMNRVLPAAGMEIVSEAIELEALSEELDFAMAKVLGDKPSNIDGAIYADAYRKVGRRADRERQISIIDDVGHALDRLVHQPLIGTTLSMMYWPAHLAGLGELQDFLQRGYTAFVKMNGAEEFLHLVVGRERRLLNALFAGDDRLLDA